MQPCTVSDVAVFWLTDSCEDWVCRDLVFMSPFLPPGANEPYRTLQCVAIRVALHEGLGRGSSV